MNVIANYPKPKTVMELRRFLGMINFYRDCLPNQADMQRSLNEYLHNVKKNDKTPIAWTPAAEKAFQNCRQSILDATTLSHPIAGAPLSIMCDASDHSLGAVLQQRDKEAWKPLAFFSKAMSATQRRYSVYDRELLAIYTAVKHFRRLIEGCDVTIYTDHKPLSYALTRPPSDSDTPRRERQLHFISQFCTNIVYTKGENNPVADALSRIEDIECPSNIDYNKLAKDQQQDEELKQLKLQPNLKFVDINMPDSKHPITCEYSTTSLRPYLPVAHRYAAYKAQHDLCHPGIKATRKLITSKFFWASMNKDVTNWARSCINCQRSKIHRHVSTPLGSFPPSQRFEHVHIDIVGPLRISNDYRYCVTMIDRCTKWTEAVPVREITSEIVAKAMYENWIARFGCPLRISTDQGRQFESSLFNDLMKRLGITRLRTTAYHPQSNGQVERWHRTLKAALMARGATNNWSDELPTVLLGLRTALREENNISPALMTYGATLRVPSDFFMSTPATSNITAEDFVRRLTHTMTTLAPTRREHKTAVRPFIHEDLAKCAHVFVRNDTVRAPLTPPYDGPYPVLQRYDKYFKIQLPNRVTVVSLDRLKPAYICTDNDCSTNSSSNEAKRTSHSMDTVPTSVDQTQPYVTRTGRVCKPNVRFARGGVL